MTVEERAAALLAHLSGLTWAEYDRRAAAVVAAAFWEAEAAAAARQRAADAAACGRVAEEFGQRFVGSRDNRDAWIAVGAEACLRRIAGDLIGGPDAGMVSDPDVGGRP